VIRFSRQDQIVLVAAASRAPSVRNIQPARWRFDDRGILLCADPARKLPASDPAGRHVGVSLGAALEAMTIALAARGFIGSPAQPTDYRRAHPETPEAIVRLELSPGGEPDALQAFTYGRATWRGRFAPDANARAAVERLAADCDDVAVVTSDKQIAEIADLFDTAKLDILRDETKRAELLAWLRLQDGHPDFLRDGLNAETLQLTPLQAYSAGVMLAAQPFSALDRLGLTRAAFAEGAKVRSAAGLVLFHRPAQEAPLETGRRFYRLWLEAEREGLAMCPMSALADVEAAAQELAITCALPRGRRLINVFRLGRRPARKPQRRFRMAPESLLE
jgi:hypothetical protein